MPCSGPRRRPAMISLSARRLAASASSAVPRRKLLILPSSGSIRCRHASASSSDDSALVSSCRVSAVEAERRCADVDMAAGGLAAADIASSKARLRLRTSDAWLALLYANDDDAVRLRRHRGFVISSLGAWVMLLLIDAAKTLLA